MVVNARHACAVVLAVLSTALAGCQQSETGDECGGGGACAAGFTLDGVFYSLGCTGIRPDALREQVATDVRVLGHGGRRTVRLVAGARGRELLAVDVQTPGCGNTGDGASPWGSAFSSNAAERSLASRLICDVGLSGPDQRAADGCPSPKAR